MIDVKLWSLERDGDNIIPAELETLLNTETEQQLEELIVKNPNLLMDLTYSFRFFNKFKTEF